MKKKDATKLKEFMEFWWRFYDWDFDSVPMFWRAFSNKVRTYAEAHDLNLNWFDEIYKSWKDTNIKFEWTWIFTLERQESKEEFKEQLFSQLTRFLKDYKWNAKLKIFNLECAMKAKQEIVEHYEDLFHAWVWELRFERLQNEILLDLLDEIHIISDNVLIKALIENAKNRHQLDKMIHAKMLFKDENWEIKWL